jgi:ATP-dependent RNA helicase MSS116
VRVTVKPPTNLDLQQPAGAGPKKKRKPRNRKPKLTEGGGGGAVPPKRGREDVEAPQEAAAVVAQAATAPKKPLVDKKTLSDSEQQYRSMVFTETPFSDVAGLSEATLRAVSQFKTMTRIQALAIPAALHGRDVLIRAKTGHGKTLAFGVPLFECLLAGRGGQGLVIAPTRELALQTKEVFESLAKEHKRRLTCFIGGTNMNSEMRSVKHERPDVLIATPGRLLDHLKQNPQLMANLAFLVLDEADRLLDEGFQRDMEAIFRLLPTNRRTILASATLPNNFAQYKHLCLRDDHVSVSAIEEGSEATNAQLIESAAVVTIETWLPVLLRMVLANAGKGLKTIVFIQAAQQTKLIAFLLGNASHVGEVFEIHSRLSQSQRIRQLEGFKARNGAAILCSSDVGARGWDIDGVDMVIQLGIPSDNDTYVHRVGRTARAGSAGLAVCLVFDWEKQHFLQRYPRAKGLMGDTINPSNADSQQVSAMLAKCRASGEFGGVVRSAYSAYLGYQNSMRSKYKLSPAECVRIVNRWICSCGLDAPPSIEARAVGKMGLKGVEGLRIENLKQPKGNNGNNNNNRRNNN